jgi:general secretion pathway protein D
MSPSKLRNRWLLGSVLLLAITACAHGPQSADPTADPSGPAAVTMTSRPTARSADAPATGPEGRAPGVETATAGGPVKAPAEAEATIDRHRTRPQWEVDAPLLAVNDDTEDLPEAGPEPNAPPAGAVEFNFDNADINEVIRTLAEILGIQYIADPNLQGQVTIHTAGGMSREDLYPLFFKILEVNGLTAVKDGPVYRISSIQDASRLPLSFKTRPHGAAGLPPEDQVIIQVIPLRNISPTEMSKVLAPFASEGAAIVAHEEARAVLVVDRKANVDKILRMVPAFDLNFFSRMSHRFYFLENSGAMETAAILQEVFASPQQQSPSVRFLPVERLNAVLSITTDPSILDQVDQMVFQLDAAGQGTEPRVFVYFVRNGTAEDLAGLLNEVYTGRSERTDTTGEAVDPAYGFSRNPFARKPKTPLIAPTAETAVPGAPADGESTALSRSVVTIIPDPVRNALIVEATPSDYQNIEAILNRIDVLPRQVLIEATIAEISLGDKWELGIEWEYNENRNYDQNQLVRGIISGADGLSYAIEFTNNILNRLDALAQKNKVNIISSPHVLASDNKEAKIDVSTEVPIVSSETTITSGAEPLVTTDIQYRDTGVLLSVTPHINERGLVTMDIYQEVSELAQNIEVAGESYPSFFKRSVDTTLTVAHGQTIVLGGLIRENQTKNRSGVPLLMDIPLLGPLFGSRGDDLSKAELIILLTPRVINSLDDVGAVTQEFERKVRGVMQTFRPQLQTPSGGTF